MVSVVGCGLVILAREQVVCIEIADHSPPTDSTIGGPHGNLASNDVPQVLNPQSAIRNPQFRVFAISQSGDDTDQGFWPAGPGRQSRHARSPR